MNISGPQKYADTFHLTIIAYTYIYAPTSQDP